VKKKYFSISLSLILVLLQASLPAQNKEGEQQVYKVGVTQRAFIPKGNYNWRGAKTHALVSVIWYPADSNSVEKHMFIGSPDNAIASAGNSSPNASIFTGKIKYPIIVLSHGTGGSALMMAWLGTEFAAHGYIAVAVNHPGNNALEDYTAQGFTLWWERARDLSTVISSMISDSVFGKIIDPGRIGAAGFSLGGYTMIAIAGGIYDASLYSQFCKSHPSNGLCIDPPEFPGLAEKINQIAATDTVYQSSLVHASDSYNDPRVRAVFAIAPAGGPAFRVESLKKISIPVYIVAGAGDSIVSVADNAEFLAKNIPTSDITVFPGNVGHYTFLADCTAFGKKVIPGLCNDLPGVNREEIHKKTVELALKFFKEHLK
jgi:predicted dienelactone hydrolase